MRSLDPVWHVFRPWRDSHLISTLVLSDESLGYFLSPKGLLILESTMLC